MGRRLIQQKALRRRVLLGQDKYYDQFRRGYLQGRALKRQWNTLKGQLEL